MNLPYYKRFSSFQSPGVWLVKTVVVSVVSRDHRMLILPLARKRVSLVFSLPVRSHSLGNIICLPRCLSGVLPEAELLCMASGEHVGMLCPKTRPWVVGTFALEDFPPWEQQRLPASTSSQEGQENNFLWSEASWNFGMKGKCAGDSIGSKIQ